MLRESLSIAVSERCELLLALAHVMARDRVVEIAHTIANDPTRSAVRLAEALLALPDSEATALCVQTLEQVGMRVNRDRTRFP
jgi:hypothetical protein